MAAGDAGRVWFAEMDDALRAFWSPGTTWEDLVGFCRWIAEERTRIRRERGIRPRLFHCPRCGKTARGEIIGVSVRSALFELRKIGIVSAEEFQALDKDWKRFQKIENLDAYGNSRGADAGT